MDQLLKNAKPENNSPIEDHFGCEIKTGDHYFVDVEGRIILMENLRPYLLHYAGANFFKSVD